MNQEISKYLEICELGKLWCILEWDEEVDYSIVTGINQIQELLFFEVV